MNPNPFQPPTAPVGAAAPRGAEDLASDSVERDPLTPAPPLRRVVAFLLDMCFLTVLLTVSWYVFLSLSFITFAGMAQRGGQRSEILVIAFSTMTILGLIGIVVGYFAIPEGSRARASLGKRLLSIEVVDLNGRQLSRWRSTLRAVAKLVVMIFYGIGFLWAFTNPRRQAVHDLLARTMVVRARSIVDLNIPDNFSTGDLQLEPWMLELRDQAEP
jgi:uncharacterized RDD family membrane protein YckC